MLKFKEKNLISNKLGSVVPILLVTIPFLIIVFSNSENFKFLPIVLGWCILCVVVAMYRINLMTNIKISDENIFAPNRGYHRHTRDVKGQVKILNGRIVIPYNEIIKIKVQNKTVYLTCQGLSNNVVLHPLNLEQFILVLKENITKLNLNIPIYNEYPKENLLEFKNDVLTNKPTLICFAIILLFPNLGGVFNIITGGGSGAIIFMTLTVLVTIITFISIFKYRTIIILSDEEVIETNQQGDIDLGIKKIKYIDIIKINKTDWRVDIEINEEEKISFVSEPTKINSFYSQLQKKVTNIKM